MGDGMTEGMSPDTVLNPGDRVTLRADLSTEALYPEHTGRGLRLVETMLRFAGREMTVAEVVYGFFDEPAPGFPRRYMLEDEEGAKAGGVWCPSMFSRTCGQDLVRPSPEETAAFLYGE